MVEVAKIPRRSGTEVEVAAKTLSDAAENAVVESAAVAFADEVAAAELPPVARD